MNDAFKKRPFRTGKQEHLFVRFPDPTKAKTPVSFRVLYFPCCGGSGLSGARLFTHLHEGGEVCCFDAPSRCEQRERISNWQDVRDVYGPVVAAEVHKDIPYLILGHSFGSLVGWVMMQYLREKGLPMPVAFMPTASRSPTTHEPQQYEEYSKMQEADAIARWKQDHAAEMAASLLDDSNLVRSTALSWWKDMVVNFSVWMDVLPPAWKEPLRVPFVTMLGSEDKLFERSEVEDWRKLCKGRWRMVYLDGGKHMLMGESECATQVMAEVRNIMEDHVLL